MRRFVGASDHALHVHVALRVVHSGFDFQEPLVALDALGDLTKAERRADLAWREQNADIIEQRRQRRDVFQNAFLEATYQLLPTQYRPDRVSITVDATRLKLYSRGVGKDRLITMPDDGRIASEPDAGFYQRDRKGNIPDEKSTKTPRISEYALEAEFAVLSSNDPSRPDAVPNIVLAYGMHIPGGQPVLAARRMVDSIWSRGHEIDHFAGDRAYLPAGDPDVLQNPLRLRGVKLLMDYPIDQLGVRGHKHGAILVEGTWYSPGMPKSLIDATKTYREALKADDANTRLSIGDRRARAAALEADWRKKLALDEQEPGTAPVARTRRNRKATLTQHLDYRKGQRMNRTQPRRILTT